MKTVLLWGSAWWIAEATEPIPFDDPRKAADALAAKLGSSRPHLRLIYQPASLEAAAMECPNAGRQMLAAALARDIPALAEAGCTWSYEPILPRGDAFTTIVHFQREPGTLNALTAALEQHGFTLESAWPLATFLAALPEHWSDSGANTVIAIQRERACAFRHGSEGRAILHWEGASTLNETGSWISALHSSNPNEPLLIVVADDERSVIEAVTQFDHAQVLSLHEALQQPVVFARSHPAQLLPRASGINAQSAMIVTGLLLFIVAGWSAVNYTRDCLAWSAEGANREKQRSALRSQVAELRVNAAEISQLQSVIARLPVALPASAFLEKLTTTLPEEIVLGSINIAAGKFAVQGFLAPATLPVVLDTWRVKFSDPCWALDPTTSLTPTGEFRLSGEFRS